jgi:hypothetical protein
MKVTELRKLIREEISKIVKEENHSSLDSKQLQLLKDLYNVIKPYAKSLDNNQIIITLNELIDVYK